MSNKLYLKNWPPASNKKQFQCIPPETAEEFLRAYLNDEIAICVGRSTRPSRGKPLKKSPEKPLIKPLRTQILMQSIFIIGQRIILKYCKGEVPHKNRMTTWRKGLAICDEFEKDGLLPSPKHIFFEKNGFVFKGRLYSLTEEKCFFVPESLQSEPSNAANPLDSLWSTAFAGFPPLGKKAAARLLEAYELKL